MKRAFRLVLLAVLSVSLCAACGNGKQPEQHTRQDSPQPTASTDACQPHQQIPTPRPTSLPMAYRTTPDEIIHHLPSPGDGPLYSDLSIATDVRAEEYTDESGETVERWKAVMWHYNDYCHVAGGRFVYVGDVVEFAGYRIKVLYISSNSVVLAISGQALDPAQIEAECASSIYNRLPDETVLPVYRESYTLDSLQIHKTGVPWIEEYVDQQGKTVEGPATRLRIVDEQQADAWEGVVHVGDIIESGSYRIRISKISDTYIGLIVGRLDELAE